MVPTPFPTTFRPDEQPSGPAAAGVKHAAKEEKHEEQ